MRGDTSPSHLLQLSHCERPEIGPPERRNNRRSHTSVGVTKLYARPRNSDFSCTIRALNGDNGLIPLKSRINFNSPQPIPA